MALDISWLKALVIGYGAMVVLDCLWIGILMRDYYRTSLRHFLATTDGSIHFNIWAALGVWFLLTVGLLFFVVPKAAPLGIITTFFWGALYGLVVYGVYEGTNFAVLRGWPFALVLRDVAWGMILNAIVAVIMRVIMRS